MDGMKSVWGIRPDQIPQRVEQDNEPKPRAKRAKKPRRCFVILPCHWMDQLQNAQHVVTFKVALHLLRESFVTSTNEIALSTVCLRAMMVGHSKARAHTELEELGLVTVERHRRRSPLVRLHHLD